MYVEGEGGELLRWILVEPEEMSVFAGCPLFLLCQLQAGVKETMRSHVDAEV